MNERLAQHYGIPGVSGSRFRRVTLTNLDQTTAGCSATDRSSRRPPIRTGPRRCFAANGCSTTCSARRRHRRRRRVNTATLEEPKAGALPPTIRRAAGAASHQRRVRDVSLGYRSAWIRARELRRDRRVAGDRRVGRACRCERQPVRQAAPPWQGLSGPACSCRHRGPGPLQSPGTVTAKPWRSALGRRLEYNTMPPPAVRRGSQRDARRDRLTAGHVARDGHRGRVPAFQTRTGKCGLTPFRRRADVVPTNDAHDMVSMV